MRLLDDYISEKKMTAIKPNFKNKKTLEANKGEKE